MTTDLQLHSFGYTSPVKGSINSLVLPTYVHFGLKMDNIRMWQSQVDNEHHSTLSGLFQLVISLECFIEITPDFLCPFMND